MANIKRPTEREFSLPQQLLVHLCSAVLWALLHPCTAWIGTKQDKNRLQRTVRSGAASTAAAWMQLLPSCTCSRALRTPGFKYPSYMMCASKRTIYSPNHLSISLQMAVSCCFGQCGQCGLRAELVIKLILSAATEQARSFLWVKSDWLSGALQTLHV